MNVGRAVEHQTRTIHAYDMKFRILNQPPTSGETMTTTEDLPVAMTGMHLTHASIMPDPDNVRADDKTEIESLAQSILINGLIQPIVLTGDNVIIAGHRRYAALGMLIHAGAIPASYPIPVVYYHGESLGQGSTQLMLVENLQRVDLNPIEEAQGYQRIVDDYELKHAEIAERVGKSTSLVSSRLRLLKLPLNAQAALSNGVIGLDVAEALVPLAKYPDVVTECINLNLSPVQIASKVARIKQNERLMLVKDFIDANGAFAATDRQELTEMNLAVDHNNTPHLFSDKATLGKFIQKDETYYLTVNYKDEVQVYGTLEVPAKVTADGEITPYEQARREQVKIDQEKKKVRRAKVMEIINTSSLSKADLEEEFDIILMANLQNTTVAFICTMLGMSKADIPMMSYSTEAQPAYDYKKAVLELLRGGGKRAMRARVAVILCSYEQFAQAGVSDEYKVVLEKVGYTVNDEDQLVLKGETDA